MEALNELSRKFSEVYEHEHPIDRLQMKDDLCDKVHSSQSLLMDPNVSQTKGRKKDVNNSKRIKSGIELSLNKKKRQCKLCEKYGHDKRNCPLNPERRKLESASQEFEGTQEFDQDLESCDED
ncbi:hypothetical protein Q3G72_034715 [Acer saccharum]|nr:hypothetical protein Q3G72_034715 [Acer saccharum]